MKPLPITVFADFACPYSYIIEPFLWAFPPDEVELRFRAYELHPVGVLVEDPVPDEAESAVLQQLADNYEAGVVRRRTVSNTRKAHEAVQFARSLNREIDFRRLVYDALWDEGLDLSRIDVLTGLAGKLDLDAEALKIALDIDRHEREVAADLDLARRLRIPGTPTIFLGTGPDASVLVGALPREELRSAITEAMRSQPPSE